MGEAKRRKADVLDMREMPPYDGSAHTLIGLVLADLANMLDTAICLKEPNDGLLEWPPGSIVGQLVRLDAVRQCPLDLDIRPTAKGWEFLLPDKLMVGAYCVEAHKRRLSFPGPIHPDNFMDGVRHFFRASNSSGWLVVMPDALEARTGSPGGPASMTEMAASEVWVAQTPCGAIAARGSDRQARSGNSRGIRPRHPYSYDRLCARHDAAAGGSGRRAD
jgi:hypothetical protein